MNTHLWEKGIEMRCKKCSKVNKHSLGNGNKFMCWRLWRLCPKCATEEHPERYSNNQKVLWSTVGTYKNKDLYPGMRNEKDDRK